ncbi:hypothetical protein D9M71_280410 [compost metagenome]
MQFVQAFHFHFYRLAGGDALGGGDGLGDAAGGGDVVFLDEEGIVEADAVVVAAAAGHGVFLRQAQAGQGLAGVEEFHLGAFHQFHVVADAGGDARQALEEVQRAALAAEQGAGRAFEVEEGLVGLGAIAVLHLPFHLHARVELAEYLVHPGRAADDGRFAGDHAGAGLAVLGDELGGDVTAADVFLEGGTYVGLDFGGEVSEEKVGHGGLRRQDGGDYKGCRRLAQCRGTGGWCFLLVLMGASGVLCVGRREFLRL